MGQGGGLEERAGFAVQIQGKKILPGGKGDLAESRASVYLSTLKGGRDKKLNYPCVASRWSSSLPSKCVDCKEQAF